MRPYREAAYAGVRVSYKVHLDGGGSTFGQDFVPLLRQRGMPKVARAFEWCAGPGLHRLLAAGARALPTRSASPTSTRRRSRPAGAAWRATGSKRRSRSIAPTISKTFRPSEQWDLVVSNPPHFVDSGIGQLRYHDPDWRVHRGFFGKIARHLRPGGVVVLQENNTGSTPGTFAPMIAQAGLRLVFVQDASDTRTAQSHMYYLGIMRPGDPVPAWAQG